MSSQSVTPATQLYHLCTTWSQPESFQFFQANDDVLSHRKAGAKLPPGIQTVPIFNNNASYLPKLMYSAVELVYDIALYS